MMSAMSASPVKPVLPPTGVNVTPPVVTSPPKIGIPIPATLTISPAKPTNMNHAPMPMGMPDHKMPQFPAQPQPGIPAMQPMMPQIPQRTPEKPKDLSAPAVLQMKPTSNGMEGLTFPNQPHMPSSTLAESQVTPSTAQATKVENQAAEMPETNAVQTPPAVANANSAEPTAAAAAPPTEPEPEKKEEPVAAKTAEPVTEANVPSVPVTQDVTPTTPATAATSVSSTQAPGSGAAPKPSATAAPAAATIAPATAPTPAPRVTAAKQPTPPPTEPAAQPVVTPSVSRTESLTHSKPEIKVATIPRQATKRKRDSKVVPATPEVKKEGKDDDRKSKRVRLPTQPYQSPLPELNIIAKISKSTKSTPSKAADDKLIVFYKNEFLAVRNAEGGFYVCQTMQNIYKSSSRIRIRWLSQEEGKDTYSPDFYDHTDFDCILTNLNLDKVEKEKFKLPQEEQQRTESILKRALDVEKGVSEKPPVTEEHPDGLDLSLYRDESQLKKSKGRSKSSRKKTNSTKSDEADSDSDEDDEDEDDEDDEEEEDEKKAKTESPPKTSRRKKKTAKKKAPPPAEKRVAAKTASSANKSSVTPAKKKTETRLGSKRKSSVSTNSQPVEKRARKSDSSSQSSERTNKTRSAEVAAGAKSRRDRRTKSRK